MIEHFRFIEANLFVICGSMPTLRRFVKHVAPKLLGDSRGTQQQSAEHERARSSFTPAKSRSSKSKSSKSASSHAGQHYSAYNRLEEHDMYSLTTFLRNEPHTSATGTVEAGLKTRDDDEGSEKAIIQDTANIVQTKTFSVQFDSKK